MILSAQTIRRRWRAGDILIEPFCERRVAHGMSYGLSSAGYDLRIRGQLTLPPGGFSLATTVDRIGLPADLMAKLTDKSTWARRGVALQNTTFEPGWRGFPTIEVSNHGSDLVAIPAGAPIGQLVFHQLDAPTEAPYSGKYQDQPQRPVAALREGEEAT